MAGPGGLAPLFPAMPSPEAALILVCDHRGDGLAEHLRPLASIEMRIEVTTRLAQTRQQLVRQQPVLVIIDPLSRGGVVELEALAAAMGEAILPVLVVTAPDDPLPALIAARTLDPGPWDLIYGRAPVEEFAMRINSLRRRADHRRELDEMRFAAVHDDRTALLRPVAFDERLHEHFAAAQRHHLDLALVLIDLDKFGDINKIFDHTMGDTVIELVGSVVRENLRTEDVGGRIGGDEFAVLLPYTPRVHAARVVGRLRKEIEVLAGSYPGTDKRVEISASIGFETYDGADVESVEVMRRHAEIALRRCKESGGNRAIYYRQLPEAQEQRSRKG